MTQVVKHYFNTRNFSKDCVRQDGPYGYRYYTIVYAIEAEDCGRIKFGRTLNVTKRLSALQGASPVKLHLLGHLWTPDDIEKTIHRHLADDRCHGEWFLATKAARAVADLIVAKKLQDLCQLIDAGRFEILDIRGHRESEMPSNVRKVK